MPLFERGDSENLDIFPESLTTSPFSFFSQIRQPYSFLLSRISQAMYATSSRLNLRPSFCLLCRCTLETPSEEESGVERSCIPACITAFLSGRGDSAMGVWWFSRCRCLLGRFGEGSGFHALFSQPLQFWKERKGGGMYIRLPPTFIFALPTQRAKNENQGRETRRLDGGQGSFIDSMLHSFMVGEAGCRYLRWD
jgi:hypothetical protein